MSLPETFTIETERLLLRALTPDVWKSLFLNSRTNEEIMQFLGLQTTEELEHEKQKFEGGLSTWRTSFVNFQLIEKPSGNIVGSCGFHTWYLQHDRAEIGYAIAGEENRRKGYMKEAIKTVLDYGFEQMKLNRVEAFIGPQNEASIKLVTSMGFQYEGLLREHYCKNGEIQDSAVYGLLKKSIFQR